MQDAWHGYVLFLRLLQTTLGIIRHFLQAASHSTDIKIQLLLEKREYLRCLTYLERAEVGRFPSRRGRMLRGFCFSSTTFFFFIFSISFFSRTETIASCDSSLLIFPTNFVPHISFVFVSRVNSSLRWFIIIIIVIIMIIVSIRIISILHRYDKTRVFLSSPSPFLFLHMYILSIEVLIYSTLVNKRDWSESMGLVQVVLWNSISSAVDLYKNWKKKKIITGE